MRDYVLTAFVAVMVPVCVARPWIGILMWYWLGLMNPHRLTWDFAYTLQFAMVIGGATLLGALFARDRRPIPWNRELVLIAVLLAYFTFTTFFAWTPVDAWPQWEKVAKVIFMTLVTTMFIYGKKRIRALLLVAALSIGFYGVKGGIFALSRGGAEMVMGPDGTFISGNTFLGLALNMVIPLLVALGRGEEKRWLHNALYGVAALCAVASIFTYSRGAWIGLAIVAPFVFFQLRTSLRVLVAIAAIVAAVAAPALLPEKVFQRADTIPNYEQDSSAMQRLQAWTVAWNVAQAYPFTGAGFEFESGDSARWLSFASAKYLRFYEAPTAAHSIYFQIIGQHGLAAFALFAWMVISVQLSLARIRREARKRPTLHWIDLYATGLQVGLLSYLISGAFLSSAYFDLAWLYFVFTAIFERELKAQETGVTAESHDAPAAADGAIGTAYRTVQDR